MFGPLYGKALLNKFVWKFELVENKFSLLYTYMHIYRWYLSIDITV